MKKKKIKAKGKLIFIYVMFCLVFIGLTGRMFYIMGIMNKKLKFEAEKQWTSNIVINPKRGDILDRNLKQLATETSVYRVDFDNMSISQYLHDSKKSDKDIGEKIANILNINSDTVIKDINKTNSSGNPIRFLTLIRGIDKTAADKIKALKITGVIVSSDTKRIYVNGNMLSQVLGQTDTDEKGLAGVEKSYNTDLTGVPGKMIVETDNVKSQLPYNTSTYTAPISGKNVVLTIDENIQDIAEKAAEKALTDNKAKSVTITVMNPKNGEILAMTSKPDFDPNAPRAAAKDTETLLNLWQNKAVQTTFEPGSIFKAITAETALEEGTETANDQFVCNGSLKVSGTTIFCWEKGGHGTESFVDILKNSCNVGFMQVGQKLGKERLYKHVITDKFGQKTGIDLPGESAGILRSIDKVGPTELATMAFGQGISVTQVQYMAAFNAIANGGDWIRPHIMKEIGHYDNNSQYVTDTKYNNFGKTKIMDTAIVSELRGYLEKVVSDGVGQNAYIKGLDIAGKTGTAQKADPKTGGYAEGKYMSSFAGMAPYQDPKITLLVSIDEPDPSKYYAGQTAAPVAKELFNDIFSYISSKNILN